jgi:RNA polymerase sigma-70 factor (ECF subfamily)
VTQKDENKTRQTLLARLKQSARDESSWQEFEAVYRNYVYGLARGMNLSHHDAEDVLQQVLLKVWNKLSSFEHEGGTGKFRGWLKTTTRNTVLNHLDKRQRATRREQSAAVELVSEADTDAIAEREWRVTLANLAWQKVREEIPDVQRRIVELDLDGVSRAEIAAELSLPLNTVSVYKRRATARLQQEIRWLDSQWS